MHWLEGGPTDLDNLALLCRAQHRAIHEGGWQLTRGPDGHITATPPHQPHRHSPPHRRPPTRRLTRPWPEPPHPDPVPA
ncbi:MAG TPA: hypothetical protein VHM23_20795 [Actinomycetota bacterium]|nr:hypothetical protein [Actinomycetota bacterium]